MTLRRILLLIFTLVVVGTTFVLLRPEPGPVCTDEWYRAQLTTFNSYPDPGSEECLAFSGCEWAGRLYGVPGEVSDEWVKSHNIVAVHEKDWDWLGRKTLELRQDGRVITVEVLDLCSDADCDGCCTRNLGAEDHLIDMEHNTALRFGATEDVVEFRLCD